MFHGFFNLPDDIPMAEQANADVCAVLRDALADGKPC
jgi:acetyl esterase